MKYIFVEENSDLVYKYNPYSSSWIGLANDEDHRFTEWEDAQQFCRSVGSHLLTLESYESMEWFRSQLLLAINNPGNCKLALRLPSVKEWQRL